MDSNYSYSPETLTSVRKWRYFVLCDLEIWWMTLENNRAPLLYYIKFVHHCKPSIKSNLSYYPETPNSGQNWRFLSCVTLKFGGWPWKTAHLFYTTLSFVQHIKAIGIFKLDLQCESPRFGSKLEIFLSRATLKIDGWPWKTIGHLFYAASSCVHHFIAIGEFTLEFKSRNA